MNIFESYTIRSTRRSHYHLFCVRRSFVDIIFPRFGNFKKGYGFCLVPINFCMTKTSRLIWTFLLRAKTRSTTQLLWDTRLYCKVIVAATFGHKVQQGYCSRHPRTQGYTARILFQPPWDRRLYSKVIEEVTLNKVIRHSYCSIYPHTQGYAARICSIISISPFILQACHSFKNKNAMFNEFEHPRKATFQLN